MAKAARSKKQTKKGSGKIRLKPLRFIARLALRAVLICAGFAVVLTLLFTVLNPPTSVYLLKERIRLGPLDREWVAIEAIAPVMARSVVAAEDANFCLHWGLDVRAIEAALEAGGSRGASTISQQVVKNVFLWHGRSWLRKAIEAFWTPVVEIFWSKRRILEIYLNVAEFDEGVFGVQAAAVHYFGVGAAELSPVQAARLAAVLPDPKGRSASNPSDYLQRRSASIRDGAATIAVDGRAACFTD